MKLQRRDETIGSLKEDSDEARKKLDGEVKLLTICDSEEHWITSP
jgi:hypothetical protein